MLCATILFWSVALRWGSEVSAMMTLSILKSCCKGLVTNLLQKQVMQRLSQKDLLCRASSAYMVACDQSPFVAPFVAQICICLHYIYFSEPQKRASQQKYTFIVY